MHLLAAMTQKGQWFTDLEVLAGNRGRFCLWKAPAAVNKHNLSQDWAWSEGETMHHLRCIMMLRYEH
jgi:hypothetical protein